LIDSAHKAERPRLCGRGRSSLFSIYLTWLQYAANYHRDFNCVRIISRPGSPVKSGHLNGKLREELGGGLTATARRARWGVRGPRDEGGGRSTMYCALPQTSNLAPRTSNLAPLAVAVQKQKRESLSRLPLEIQQKLPVASASTSRPYRRARRRPEHQSQPAPSSRR
jgi:hypothetical protein